MVYHFGIMEVDKIYIPEIYGAKLKFIQCFQIRFVFLYILNLACERNLFIWHEGRC